MKELNIYQYRKTKLTLVFATIAAVGLYFGISRHEYSLETAKKAAVEAMLSHVEAVCGKSPKTSRYEIVVLEITNDSIGKSAEKFRFYAVSASVRHSGIEVGKLDAMVFNTLSIFGLPLNGTDITGTSLHCEKS
jgi:hypothetical protein